MKSIIGLFALVLSASAQAESVDFSVMNEAQDGHGRGKLHECMKTSWQAAQPTEDQNNQACGFIREARAIVDTHKEAIKTGMRTLMNVYRGHPIVRDDVISAEQNLHGHFVPVQGAVRDARISVINLLSNEQRMAFNTAFHDCMHKE